MVINGLLSLRDGILEYDGTPSSSSGVSIGARVGSVLTAPASGASSSLSLGKSRSESSSVRVARTRWRRRGGAALSVASARGHGVVESSQSNCIEIDCNIRVACRPRGARAEKSACLRENRVPRFSARVVPCMRATRGSVVKAWDAHAIPRRMRVHAGGYGHDG